MVFLNGFCFGGAMVALIVLLYECVNNEDRPLASAVYSLGWALGGCLTLYLLNFEAFLQLLELLLDITYCPIFQEFVP